MDLAPNLDLRDCSEPSHEDWTGAPPDRQSSWTSLDIKQKEEVSTEKADSDPTFHTNDVPHVNNISNPQVTPSSPDPRKPLAIVEKPKAPVSGRPYISTQGRPLTPIQGGPSTLAQGRAQTPTTSQVQASPPALTSAPATVASFPSVASIAPSFVPQPNSSVASTRGGFSAGSQDSKGSSLTHSPATQAGPIQPSNQVTSSDQPTTPNPELFDFQRFLDQLKSRPAEPVAKYLRSFLNTFSMKSFTVNDQIRIVHDFLVFISARMRECEVWEKADETEFDNAVEDMEKLVMTRLYQSTFTPQIARSGQPVTTDDLERDRVLKQRISLFQWIRPEHLDIPKKLKDPEENEKKAASSDQPNPEYYSPANAENSADSEIMKFLLFAQQEINEINHYKAPREKLLCVINSCKVIFGLIRYRRGDEGTNSFIPLLVFVLIRANPEHLLSNIEYINRFRRPSKLQSEADYYLSSLMGAVFFIESMDHTSLSNITRDDFEKNVEEAVLALPPSPVPTSPTIAPAIVSSRSITSGSSQRSSAARLSSVGEESSRTPHLRQVAAIAEDTRKLLERTGVSLSKPLNAIGRIFSEVLEDEPRSPSSGYPEVSPQGPYRPHLVDATGGGATTYTSASGVLPPPEPKILHPEVRSYEAHASKPGDISNVNAVTVKPGFGSEPGAAGPKGLAFAISLEYSDYRTGDLPLQDPQSGTGTGGVIACMLGKMGMSIKEAVESYTRLTEAVFSNKKKGGITGGAAYKSTALKESLRFIIQAATGDGDTKMSEGASKPDSCNTLIFATLKDNINASIPAMFRSYQARTNRAPDCAMWEALYATMAHPDFFKSIDIAEGSLKYSFVGGELGNSNPLAHVLAEVRDLYPDQYVSCIMSVGAGHAHTIRISNTSHRKTSLAMRAMATGSERVAEEMARRFQDTTGVYFRFNVDQGIQDVGTGDWEKLGTVGAHTRAYLSKNEVDRGMREATKAMHDRNNALAVAWIDGRVQRTLEPAIVKKCPAPSSYYTGRAKETQGVGSCIVNNGNQQQVCVIYGLGGAGKSQLAFKTIQQNYHHWNHIVYVDAASNDTIEKALGDFAKVNLKYLGDTHTLTYADTLLWLQGTQDPWLLFFDGADDLHLDIRPYFPSYRGSILVTTRLEARAGLAQPPESVYHVSGMDPEDASSLLLRVVNRGAPCESKTTADKNAADVLVKDFGFLALAIVHAGAYIAHSTGMSISYYRKLFHKKRQATLEKYITLPESSRFDNYDKTVYTTWNMCYELLGERRNKGAQELLWLIAFLYHDGITMDIFQRAMTNIHLYVPILPVTELEEHAHAYLFEYLTRAANTEDSEGEENWAENSFLEIVGDLAAYSLIEYDRRNKAYTIHVLVQDWARSLIPHTPNISLERTATLLAVSIGMSDEPDPDSHDFRVGLESHVKRVWSANDSYELLSKKSHHWEVNLNHAVCFANVFRSVKLWHEEENLRIKVRAARKKLLGLEHPATLQSTDDLAQNYVNQGWYDRAESLYSEVLEVRRSLYREIHGEGHENIITSKRSLATIYLHQGRLGEAIPFWEDVVQGYRVSKGGNNPETLACMDSLADAYRQSTQLDKALGLRKDMLNLMPDNSQDKPTCMKKLAEVLELKEEWDAAEQHLVRRLEVLNALWGNSHTNAVAGQQHLYEFRVRRKSIPPDSCDSCTFPTEVASLCPNSQYICYFVAHALGFFSISFAILVTAKLFSTRMQLLPDPPVTTSSERSVVEGALENIKCDPNTLSQCPLQRLAPEEDPGPGSNSNSSARPTSIDSCQSEYKTRVLSDKRVFFSVRAVMGDPHQDQVYRLCVEQLGGIYISGSSFGENLNGVLGQILKSADIFITPHRDNQEYIQATQCNLTIGTPSWITHISSTGAWSAPEEHLLHYPYPEEPARGFEDQMVTTTRYSGKAREYVKKMVVALGGRYTPHLTDVTTCVIAA
ncbi:putative calcium-independent phospholipase A2-gamma, partial [Rhizoctonia solani 123E]